MKNAFVLWTGGKDCFLALHKAQKQGYSLRGLVTFTPPKASFLAHPLPFLEQQAKAINLPWYKIPITPPYKESYQKAMQFLIDNYQATALITGDIDFVGKAPHWISECAKDLPLEIVLPLWQRKREEILNELLENNATILISCTKKTPFGARFINRMMTKEIVDEIYTHKEEGIDPCGEQGEYHTLVLDGPLFKQKISCKTTISSNEDFYYLAYENIVLNEKTK